MSEIFLPFFKNSKNWSNCCEDRQKTLLQNIEKCSEVLTESGKHLPIMQILKMPPEIMTVEQRMCTSPTKVYDMENKEQILSEWIANIETIVYSSDKRQADMFTLLYCYKISEAINESRDKVKYLEFIKSHLLELQNTCCPEFVMYTVIPNIIAAIKKQNSLTRHFARSGFLTLLLQKVQVNKTVTESLYKQLNTCIQMTNSFRDSIIMLQTSIFVHQGNSLAARSASHISLQPYPNLKLQRASTTNINDFCRTMKGISFYDEEAIFSNLHPLIHQMKKVIYIIETFSQFSLLTKLSVSLPLFKSEDLETEKKANIEMLNEDRSAVFQPMHDIKDCSLPAVKEEDAHEEKENEEKLEEICDIKKRNNLVHHKKEYNSNDYILKTYFADEENCSILLNVFGNTMRNLTKIVQKITTVDVLHTNLDDSGELNNLYCEFQSIITESELLIRSYLDAIFRKDLSVEQSLDILDRFSSVSKRTALVPKIERCYVKVFNHYASDLLEQCDIFQQNKENPPMPRNSPKVAGTIQWCKFTLKKIKYPMEILMDICVVQQLPHFSNFVKIYNETITTIQDFERKTIGSWMKNLVNVVDGLSAALLTYHLESKELHINIDPRLLIAIEETKSMVKMGVPIPKNAKAILLQEDKLKNYKMHLELCIHEFDETKGILPKIWQQLFKEHYCQMSREFQPGLSSLSWNSLNIDAFLCTIRSAGYKLRDMTHGVHKIIYNQIDEVIEQIEDMSLFSMDECTLKHQHYEDIQKTMTMSIEFQIDSLNNHIHTMQNAIQDILDIVTATRISPKYGSKGTAEDKVDAEINEILEKDKNHLSKKIIAYYREKLYHAVEKIILRSLVFLLKFVSSIEESDSPKFHSSPIETANLLADNSTGKSYLRYETYLLINSVLVYNIPDFALNPPAAVISNIIRNIALKIKDISKGIPLIDIFDDYFHDNIVKNERINDVFKAIEKSLSANENIARTYVQSFNRYDFLWTRNRYESFDEFLTINPNKTEIQNKIEEFIVMEKELARIPQIMKIGLLSVKSDPVKQSLQALLLSWKTVFASVLHTDAYNMLKAACIYRRQVFEVLSVPIKTLEQLNNILYVLQQIRDMQNKIDQIYLPIELAYHKLLKYCVPLPRSEIKEVEDLRNNWNYLTELAEATEKYIFTDKRLTFEQEIHRENMFRNSFDGEGPNIPDSSPEETVERLDKFQEECLNLKKERETLETVSKTFGVLIDTFTELDQTEEDLKMVYSLYDLYIRFIQFDDQFQNTLWSDVDFRTAVKMVELFWDDYLLLSEKLQEYNTYHSLKTAITMYQETIPILKLLHSKTIRNRHWLQIMTVTENTFPLEVTVLRLSHLFNINLPRYKSTVVEICHVSMKEMELETMMSKIEEEWTEQELIFKNYKTLGPVTLDHIFIERLLEQLEDSQVTLANMLTSPYISPMQEDVNMWTEKLKELGFILELWIDVQKLWIHLEAVFSNSSANKELQQQNLIFAPVNTSWCKVMARYAEMKNFLQACCGEMQLKSVLLHIQEDLESCSRSLGNYLEKKRMQFPRFFFLSNPVLLATLSCPQSLESILPILGYVHEIETEVLEKRREILSESAASDIQFDQNTEIFTTVPVCHSVEWWLNELKHTIHDTIGKMSLNAIQEITQATNLEEFIAKYPTQICQLGVLYLWSREVEKGIMEVKHERKALFNTYKKFCTTYSKILTLFSRSFSKSSCDTKSTHIRIRYEKIVTQTLYLRDTLYTICRKKVKHCTDFDWRRYLKCYLVSDNDTELKLHFEILDHHLVYGNEFCGSNPSIIMTPVTEKCFLSIFLALQNLQPVYLVGTPDVGKKETIKSLANVIAQFYYLLKCNPHFDASSIQRIIQGSSMEGCWLCLADGNKLSHKSLDVVMDQVAMIVDAVRVNNNVVEDIFRKLTYKVNPRTAFFMTATFSEESNWYSARNVKSVFRTVTLLKPDTYYILRGYFISAGFKFGNILAGKLLEIVSLAELQLISSECQIPSFTLSSMIATIRRAQQIRKTLEEKYGEKPNTVRPETTPSTTSRQSQISLTIKESSENLTRDIDLSTLLQSIEETLYPALDNNNNFKTWFLIDSQLNDDWLDQLSSVFNNKQIQLKNGDIVPMNGNVKTFIETDSIDSASPMTITKLGMIYFSGLVTWEVLTKSWIKAKKHKNPQINGSKNGYDIAEILMQCYQNSMDPVIQYFKTEMKHSIHFNEVGMITTSLQILTVLLSNCHTVSSDTHIKKLFVFSLLWSFGGHLSSNDRLHFNEFLQKIRTNLIPEDENDVYLFDYFVDESGEWENWNIKSLEESPVIQDNFSREFVYTQRTIPIKYFINNFILHGFPSLLTGPKGSGKTSLINALMSSLDSEEYVLKRFVSSGSSTTVQLFDFFNSSIIHRQGFIHGAKDKKKLAVFIEDINIPKKDQFGIQRCNEFLRQLLDGKIIYDPSSPFEMKFIEDLCLIAEMTHPEPRLEQLNQRLLRQFAIFNLPEPEENDLSIILGKKLETAVNGENLPNIDTKLFNNLVEASYQLLSGLQSTLKLSSLPGSTHYMFTIQSLEHCFKGLTKLPLKERTNENFIILLLIHDIQNVLLDSVCRNEDHNFFKQLLRTVVNDKWPDIVITTKNIGYFITVPSRNRPSSHSPLLGKPINNVLYQTEGLYSLEATIQRHIDIYNSDHPKRPLQIIPSEHVISQITKVHRVLTCSDRSHLLSVSSVVSDIVDIYMLTCEMTNTTTIQMDWFTGNDLFEVLKTAVKQAGSLNTPVAFILKESNLLDPLHLDCINNFLVIEDYTTLYSTEELSTLLQSLELQLKKDHLERAIKPVTYFCNNVKRNLHILIHLTPSNPLLSNIYREYPGILKSCQINWLLEWSEETLVSMTPRYLNESGMFHENNLRNRIIKCLTNIHKFMFKEYNKAPWTGNLASHTEIVQVESSDCKTDPVKVFNETVDNLPYTQRLLLDHIGLQQEVSSSSTNQANFISTKTYEQLLHCFQYLINLKNNEQKEKMAKINKTITKLKDTRERLQNVTKVVKFKTAEYNTAKIKSEEYLEEIIHKATQVESLKTQIGQNLAIKAILDNHQFTNFLDQADTKELLTNDDYDSYDEEFHRLMAENLEKKENHIEEDLAKAKKQIPYKEKCVELSKEKIYFWKSKIDRNCIESIRGFANPPNLVVHVINIVLIMTGKLNPLTYFNISMEDQEIQLISSEHYKNKFQISWKAVQHILSESKKFIDLLHNFSFEQGLKPSVIQAISSYLSPQEIQINLQSIQTAVQSDTSVQHVCKVLPGNGITVAEAKHASKDVAILLQYVLSLVVYSTFCKELQELNETIKELEEQIFRNSKQNSTPDNEIEITSGLDNDMEVDFNKDAIPVLEKEIESLQRPYREAVELKHSLEKELQNKNDEIKATRLLLESLKSKESEWCSVAEKESSDTLIYNCIMASSFLSYCSPFNIQTREKICNQFKKICSEHGFLQNCHQVFEDLSLHEFLFPPLLRVELEISSSLPTSKVFLENCCFFVDDKMWTTWPILCDPNCWALECQQIFLKSDFVTVPFNALESQLEMCLNEGLILFVTNCDSQKLHTNRLLLSVIFAYRRFIQATHTFKIWTGDLEVECNPSFRLYLHTSSDASLISDTLSPYLTIITFSQSYECLYKDLFLRCINREKSQLKDERNHFLQEKWDKTKESLETEDKLLMGLCQEVDLLKSKQTVKELTELVNQHSEIKERLLTVLEEEENVLREATEHLSILASQGAICYYTMQHMKQLHPLYRCPYSSFLKLFHSVINELDCTNSHEVADQLTYLANQNMIQTLRYQDRIVFTLFLAFEIDSLKGYTLTGEREFVIDPLTTSATNPSLENIAALKNPFEWMPDEVFHNLQNLAMRFSWFTEIFVNLTKEGKDSSLKLLFDSQYPEQYNSLPTKLNVLTPLQILCFWRALRPKEFLLEATSYISSVLGSKFVANFLPNIPLVVTMTNPTYPILVFTNTQSGEADVFFSNFFKGQKYEMISLHVSTCSSSAETALRKYIWQKMSQDVWIILKNAHNWPSLLLKVSSWLLEKTVPNPMFRCCLSVDVDFKDLPTQLLDGCFKIFIDSPMHAKDHLQWSSTQLNPDILNMNSSTHWPLLLYNICMLYMTFHLRTNMIHGWVNADDVENINSTDLQEAIKFAGFDLRRFSKLAIPNDTQMPCPISLSAIRYVFSEIIFGRYLQHTRDQICLKGMVEYLVSANSLKKNFEYSKLKYSGLTALYNSPRNLANLQQELGKIPNQFLASPQMCHLHKYQEMEQLQYHR
ncbi:dynein heavy chain 8, axonemal-like [Octopus vulgaris]|uniref:Dynein heavy chain 8, axonemal-like n=1 Tax=Octopus vulgaris TaxID=6645 RepID=A0AA36EZJ1_OCTVU|nr:dynein heavy chain 8, axonemal-like [Octopus vulgaris]